MAEVNQRLNDHERRLLALEKLAFPEAKSETDENLVEKGKSTGEEEGEEGALKSEEGEGTQG